MSASVDSLEKIRIICRAYEGELMAKANVVGVGIGFRQRGGVRTNTPALVVMVSKKVPLNQLAVKDVIPTEIEGVPVDVQEVSEIRAL